MKNALKWLKKPSISKRLIISFTLVLVLPIITLSTISYQIAKEELDHEIMYGANTRVNELNDMIQQKLMNKENAVKLFTETSTAQTLRRTTRMNCMSISRYTVKSMKMMWLDFMRQVKSVISFSFLK